MSYLEFRDHQWTEDEIKEIYRRLNMENYDRLYEHADTEFDREREAAEAEAWGDGP